MGKRPGFWRTFCGIIAIVIVLVALFWLARGEQDTAGTFPGAMHPGGVAGGGLAGIGPTAEPAPQGGDAAGPIAIVADKSDLSPPLRDIPPIPPMPELLAPENEVMPGRAGGSVDPDEVAAILQDWHGSIHMPPPSQSWEGINNLSTVFPPDTQGDVGLNHYIQWVNLWFQIWNKTGTSLYGPAAGNTLWSGFGGPCESTNDGDPITLYDQLADRWVMSQFALPNYPAGPFYQCFAISQSPDPLGAWYRYQFTWPNNYMNDYPKIGVWPDGYYISVNQFAANNFQWRGAGVAAFERSRMLQGLSAQMIYFNLYTVDPDYGGLLPSDWDGSTQPPSGAPNYFASWDDSTWGVGSNDAVHIWAFHVDWATPANSTFGDAGHFPNWTLNTNNIDPNMCNYTRNCIPQPGGYYLDAISDRLMYRLQYRNFGTYESMVCNRTVDTGSDHAGIYWFEVRKTGTEWTLYQQGIYSPDSTHRWMGSIAQDRQGNMALGFSVSSSSVYPGIRYVGRLVTDALGTMPQGETVLQAGGGSQTDNQYWRWGDYSMMSVDPADDCTFWYTQEYYQSDSSRGWRTRIGAFKFPGCVPGPTPTPTPTPTNTPTPTFTPTPTPTYTPTPGPSPTPTPTSPLPPPEGGGEQAPECLDDAAGTLSLPGRKIAGVVGPLAGRVAAAGNAVRMGRAVLKEAPASGLMATEIKVGQPPNSIPGPGAVSLPAPAPEAVAPIPNIKVEGMANSSGWVTSVADNQGNLYTAFEYPYASGCGGTCYATVAGKSRNNGQTWDLWYVVASTTESARRPTIAVDGNGQLYIAMELYFNGASGLRWYAAVATSDCVRDVSAWSITYWNTTYALIPGGTDADAGGDGNDFYAQFQVPYENDGQPDLLTVWSLDGGASWTGGILYATGYTIERPTTQVGTANVSCSFYYNNATRYLYYGAIGANCVTSTGVSQAGASYADGDGSGSYHYVAYQRRPSGNDNIYIRYSTNDGSTFSGEVGVDTATGNQTYPAVSANGAKVRVAYINGSNQTLLRTSDNNGASWSSAYTLNTSGNTTVNGFHYVGLAFHPIGGAADGKHPIALWVDNRDSGAGQGNNIYLGTINDRPVIGTLSWPSNGATITAFAPALRWNAATDPDGDTVRYWWFVDTTNPPAVTVGGPVALTTALPFYTDPGVTYYWKVRADDGYQTSATDSAVWSFTTSNDTFSGSPGTYTQDFASDPPYWTKKGFACLDCFEADPIRWAVSPSGKWVRSNTYAWSGDESAHALYDADNADYQMASPASGLDLRGSAWAYFNTHFRGSSESGYDWLYLESIADGAGACWTTEDARNGDYNSGWWVYYEGNIDLSAFAGTTTGRLRFRFDTDASNYGGTYGVGWYEDEVEVARESEWAWRNTGPYYYRLQTQGAFVGYTNNLVDQFYSPYILLPNNSGMSIRMTLSERFDIASGDYATVWIRDAAADTWQKLASYNGTQSLWTDRTILIPDGYKGRVVVLAFVLRSDGSGTLGGPEETGGYWDVDNLFLEEYAPTAVKLTSFAARPAAEGILVTWETASEHNNLGFHLYRSSAPGSLGQRLNETLIPSEAPGGEQGAAYEFLDTSARAGAIYYYTLEDVDYSGRRTPHGPLVTGLWRFYLPMVGRIYPSVPLP